MRLTLTMMALLLAAPSGYSAEAWPSFRGNPQMTGVSSDSLPAKPDLLWTHQAGSGVQSTAAIVDGRVYVGTDKGLVLALSLADGKKLWSVESGDTVSASPCVVDNVVYVGNESGLFLALDAKTGKEQWRFKAEDKIISSATPAPGVILFGSYDMHLYCLDAKTGKQRWAVKTKNYVHGSPCVIGEDVVVAGCDGDVRFIRLADGKQRVAAETDGNFAAAAAHRNGRIFLGDMAGVYRAINTADAKIAWQFEDRKGGACFSGAAVTDDLVVFASRSRQVSCVRAKDGKLVWRSRTKGQIDSSPVIVGGTVYVGASDGVLHALDLADGSEVWRFTAGSEILASPAVAKGRLVIGAGDGAIYCFGDKTAR